MASRPLLSPLGEENTLDPLSYERGGVNLALGRSSDTETGQNRNLHVVVESRENESLCCNVLASGKLFRYITKATGLWNPREKHYGILCGFIVVVNLLSLAAEILIPSICGPSVDRCLTQRSGVTNNSEPYRPYNTTIYEITLAFAAWNALSDTVTFILLIYTLWQVHQRIPLLCLATVDTKVSSREWLFINVVLIVFAVAITVSIAFQVSIVESSKWKLFGTFGLAVLIVYLTAFICSSVFVVLTCALRSLVDECLQEICATSHASLNDIIAIHRNLYGQLVTASQILTPWFLVHWAMFGVYCFVVFAFDSLHFNEVLDLKFRGAHTTFQSVTFALNFAIFFLPCVFASRVTWKCEDILFKLNNMSAKDWNEGHPFRERNNVNAFLFYAERSRCGFRIRNITFGSSGTWISVLLGLFGFGLRLFQHFQ